MKNVLYYGDNLEVLRDGREFPDACVDLVYLDPPFNSDATYNVLFAEQDGSRAAAQIQAFEDTWRWDEAAVRAYKETVEQGGPVAELLTGMRGFLGDNNLLAYLSMMAPRLQELHRVLTPTGTLYLHCDPTASHYLKILLDAVFGADRFLNEITWKRTTSHGNVGRNFGSLSDTLLVYTKTDKYKWNQQYSAFPQEYIERRFTNKDPDGRRWQSVTLRNPSPRPNLRYPYTASNGITYEPHPNGWACGIERMRQLDAEGRLHFPTKPGGQLRLKMYLDESPGIKLQNIWEDVPAINSQAAERLGYPTQKPEALLERIIRVSTDPGDVVLDPFCGCGTTITVAHRLDRRWIGIDLTHLAIGLMKHRLKDTFGDEVEETFEVHGEPADVESARYLAEADRYQFEWWALGLVGARRNEKKGADQGVDGVIWFHDERGKSRKAVLQVKSGKVGTPILKELRQTVEEQQGALGVLLTLEEPTKPMRAAAADAGTYESGWGSHPRIQILTIRELLDGARIDMPPMGTRTTFQRAPRHMPVAADEPSLFDER